MSEEKIIGYYGGRPTDGKGQVLVIDGETWTWKDSKFMSARFSGVSVGMGFEANGNTTENEDGSRTLHIEWKTFTFTEMSEDLDNAHVMNDAMGRKARSIKSASKKLTAENIENLTIKEIRERLLYAPKNQQAAMFAVVMAELRF